MREPCARFAPGIAQDYPARRTTVVVPSSAGGAIDVAARLVSPKVSEYLGQPIVVENRIAGGGVLAMNQVAQSPPDGYTLLAVLAASPPISTSSAACSTTR